VTALAAAPESELTETGTDEAKAKAEAEKTPFRQAARLVWAML